MEIKAKDMCPRCKYCLGRTPQGMYSCGKADDGSELNIGIDVILNCANFEWKDGKAEGKAKDWCKKCKHCSIMKCLNGVTEFVCEDPYDGMTKTLNADSNICCSMFEARPNPTHVCYEQGVKTVKPGEKVDIPDHGRYPWGSDEDKVLKYCVNDVTIIAEQMVREKQMGLEAKIKDLFEEKDILNNKIDEYEKILCDIYSTLHPYSAENKNISAEMAFIRLPKEVKAKTKACKDNFDECIRKMDIIDELKAENTKLKEENDRLKNQVKNLQTTNEESYKREEKLEDKVHKLERRLLEENRRFDRFVTEFLTPLTRVLYPGEKVGKLYSEILTDIKLLNKGVYDLKEDNKRLASKVETLKEKNENLTKAVERRDKWVEDLKSDVGTLKDAVLEIHNIAQVAYNDIDSN